MISKNNKHKTYKLGGVRQVLLSVFLCLPIHSGHASKDQVEKQTTDDQLTHYHISIENLETEYGPYHGQLSQQLLSLGQHYRLQGLLDIARDALQRAMHISRINSGLYSLEQTTILKELAHTNNLRNDWESVDANKHYMYWIHKRNYGENDPRMLPVLNELGRWHLQAYEDHYHEGNAEHLLRAHDFYRQAILIVSEHYGDLDPRLLEHLHGYTAINYYLASHQIRLYQEVDDTTGARNFNMDNEDKRRLIQYINNSYRNGKKSIDTTIRIHNSNDQASDRDKINAELSMADWNLLFGRWNTAIDLYKSIYKHLKTSLPDDQNVDDIFAKPVPLPNLVSLKEKTEQIPQINLDNETETTDIHYVVATFDVSPRGSARNIEFVDAYPEDNIQNRIDVRRTLKTSKFRPRLEAGEPVITERFTQKFVFRE